MGLEEMGPDKPLVSIIITSYNRAYCIGKAIDSAMAQDYDNIEIVISDNCSTDETDDLIAKYTADFRVRFFKNTVNIGMIPNFRKATHELAKGEYVVYVSSDDYLDDPQFVSSAMRLIAAHNNIRMVFARMTTYNIHSDTKQTNSHKTIFEQPVWEGFEVFKRFPDNGFLCFGGCLMKLGDVISLKVFDSERLNIDNECILKMMVLGDVGFINRNAYVFVRHGENESGDMTATSHISKLEYIEEVYAFAKQRISADKMQDLDAWKNAMVSHSLKTSLYFLHLHNPGQRKIYEEVIRKKYPANLKHAAKDRSWYLKVKLNHRLVLFLYRIFKPAYYHQEFSNTKDKTLKAKLS